MIFAIWRLTDNLTHQLNQRQRTVCHVRLGRIHTNYRFVNKGSLSYGQWTVGERERDAQHVGCSDARPRSFLRSEGGLTTPHVSLRINSDQSLKWENDARFHAGSWRSLCGTDSSRMLGQRTQLPGRGIHAGHFWQARRTKMWILSYIQYSPAKWTQKSAILYLRKSSEVRIRYFLTFYL